MAAYLPGCLPACETAGGKVDGGGDEAGYRDPKGMVGTVSVSEDDTRLSYIPFDEAVEPMGGTIECRKDRWWIVHPQRGLIIWKGFSPQCNHDKGIAERVRDKLYPWAEVRFFPSVFTRTERRAQ